jgi:hypothetical protein
MTEVTEKAVLKRLEDFIALSREGKDIKADVELKKQVVKKRFTLKKLLI